MTGTVRVHRALSSHSACAIPGLRFGTRGRERDSLLREHLCSSPRDDQCLGAFAGAPCNCGGTAPLAMARLLLNPGGTSWGRRSATLRRPRVLV
jgi:hypothetical protein